LAKIGPLVAVSDRLAVPRYEEERSAFYQEWVYPNNLGAGLMSALAPLAQDTVVFTLLRSRGGVSAIFEDSEGIDRYRRLLPYLGRATALRKRLADTGDAANDASLAALNALRMAAFLVDDRDRLLWANSAAENLFRRDDGLRYTAREGFRAMSPDGSAAVYRLFAQSARGVGGDLRLDRPSGGTALLLTAIPCRSRPNPLGNSAATPKRPISLIFVSVPEAETLGGLTDREDSLIDRIRLLYNLTRTEALIAIHITRGAGLPLIARTLHLSPETVRTHTKRIFAKVDVHSQAQLVGLVTSLGIIGY